jgi:hypothetical protein
LKRSPPDWFQQAIALAGRQFVAIAASAEIPSAVFELSLQARAFAGPFAAFAAIPPEVFEHSLQ